MMSRLLNRKLRRCWTKVFIRDSDAKYYQLWLGQHAIQGEITHNN